MFKRSIGVAPITRHTHVRNKNSYIKGRSPNVAKSDFPYLKELLLKVKNSLPSVAFFFPFREVPILKRDVWLIC